jgi:glycosyltransferase involved in cell wall biosynthesis
MQLSLVVPCYNEEAMLPLAIPHLRKLLADLVARGLADRGSTLWLVDDGSRDRTWALIEGAAREFDDVVGIKLSRNCGHQKALLAGLLNADGDAVISLDADLQDDPGVIEQMIREYQAGAEIVYGVRRSRPDDTFFKRWTAQRYYGLLRRLGVEIIPDHADFRLMGRNALRALADYPEANLFLRGLVPQLGFASRQVFYDRGARAAGESKYPLRKMLRLAMDGVTSFSAVPLRIIAGLGALVFVLSLCITVWVLFVREFTDRAVPGWASITLPIYLLGGLQLLSLGVVGEYVAKVYLETKRRPRFLIERITHERGGARVGGSARVPQKDANDSHREAM